MEFDSGKIISNKQIRKKARNALKTDLSKVLLFCFVYFIILKAFNYFFVSINLADTLGIISLENYLYFIKETNIDPIGIILLVVKVIFSGIFTYGLYSMILEFAQNKNVSWKKVFRDMRNLKNFLRTFLIFACTTILKIVWAIFIIIIFIFFDLIIFIPSIIFMISKTCLYDILDYNKLPLSIVEMLNNNFIIIAFILLCFLILYFLIIIKYDLVYLIAIDNKNLNFLKCIKRSKRMIGEYRIKLFFLYLGFVDWFLFSIITLGFGFLFLKAYSHGSIVIFYENLKEAEITKSSLEEILTEEHANSKEEIKELI